MKAALIAGILGAFSLGFGLGRADGNAFAGVVAASLAGLLIGVICTAGGLAFWSYRVEKLDPLASVRDERAAHVEQEI